jgi:3-oxoacid CoA-transferase
MINKVYPGIQQALADIQDGASIMIGGFYGAGTPHNLIQGLVDKGNKNLTLICNSSNNVIPIMKDASQVKSVIMSFPISPYSWAERNPLREAIESGQVKVEMVPQGTLAERIRAGGAGIAGFYTRTSVGTILERGKEKKVFDDKSYVFERAITADYALIKAHKADTKGNLIYRGTMRNFNISMAMAAKITIAEVDEIVQPGELGPESINTPGIFVDRVVKSTSKQATNFKKSGSSKSQDKSGEGKKGLTNELIAIRIAKELPDGAYVNLGMGLIPAMIPNFVPEDREIVFESENGILGYGRIAEEGEWDANLVAATGQPVTVLPGASFFDSADSFAMVRGGHIDYTILGAYQVSEKGDIANWATSEKNIRGVGGAMDLAAGTKHVFVAMEHTTSSGELKILKECAYPLTATGVVTMIFTNLAVIQVTPEGLLLREITPGISVEEIQAVTEPKLIVSKDLKEIEF